MAGGRTALSRKFCWLAVRGRRLLGGVGEDRLRGRSCEFSRELGGFVAVEALRMDFWSAGTRNPKRGDWSRAVGWKIVRRAVAVSILGKRQ
jgi:hypothetical protein